MIKKTLGACIIALTMLLFAACNKKEVSVDEPAPSLEKTSGLKLTAVGDYGTCRFISSEGGLSAEVTDFGLMNGATARLAAFTSTQHQKWRVTYIGDGYFTIMNHGTGKFAQAYNYNG
ncbi:MAG: hypothetical protein EOP47_24740, partial [Sphingobacteriaceae bacterium]